MRSYEFYYPAVVARQLGFSQVPPYLFYSDNVRARAPITSNIEFNWVVGLTDDLNLGVFANLILDPVASRPYLSWWSEWHRHIFCKNSASWLQGLTLSKALEEVTFISLL